MTSVRGAGPGPARWPMLAVVSLGIVALTLNWFDVATAFPLIGAQFKVGLGSLGLLISLYIVGYGLMHIPGGVLATKIGMKRTLVLGLLVQGAAGVMSGLSHSYVELAFFRVASGIGGSVFVAVTAAAMVVWFRGNGRHFCAWRDRRSRLQRGGRARSVRLALRPALGGLAHLDGPWRSVRAVGRRWSPLRRSGFQKGGHSLGGMKFDRAALRSALMTRDLWVYGIALLGGYGAYFTTSQLFSEYVTTDRHFDPSAGGLLSALILLAGIPGSVLGGHLADRSTNLRMFVVGPLVAIAVLLALIPVVPNILLWPLGIGIGFFLIFGFTAWLAVPSRVSDIRAEHIGSATGLMLTLAAIGGFFVPIIFGRLVPHTSYGAGWIFLAVLSFVFALVGMAGHNPSTAPAHAKRGAPAAWPAQTQPLMRPAGCEPPAGP